MWGDKKQHMEKYKNILSRDTASSDVRKNLDGSVQQEWQAAESQIQGHPQNRTWSLRQLIAEIVPFPSGFSSNSREARGRPWIPLQCFSDPTTKMGIQMGKGLRPCPVRCSFVLLPARAWPLRQAGILSTFSLPGEQRARITMSLHGCHPTCARHTAAT